MLRLVMLASCAFVASNLSAATFTVTTTADSGPGSLRQAILDSNANGDGDSDTIAFAIPGTGPHVITPTSGLPGILTRNITIDGYTQPGVEPEHAHARAGRARQRNPNRAVGRQLRQCRHWPELQ